METRRTWWGPSLCETQNWLQPHHSSGPFSGNNTSPTSHKSSLPYNIHYLKRFSNVSLEWFCNFHPLLLVLSNLGIENRLLLFATPFYDSKTYCIWPHFSFLGSSTQFLSNWWQYFIIRNGFFLPFSFPFLCTTQLLLLHHPLGFFPHPPAYRFFFFYLLFQWI